MSLNCKTDNSSLITSQIQNFQILFEFYIKKNQINQINILKNASYFIEQICIVILLQQLAGHYYTIIIFIFINFTKHNQQITRTQTKPMQPQIYNVNDEEGNLLQQERPIIKITEKIQYKKSYLWLTIIILIGIILQLYIRFISNHASAINKENIEPKVQRTYIQSNFLKLAQQINEQLQQHQYRIKKLKTQKQLLLKSFSQYNFPLKVPSLHLNKQKIKKLKSDNQQQEQLKVVLQPLKLKKQQTKQQKIIIQEKPTEKKNQKPVIKPYQYGDFVDYPKFQRMKKHKESISSSPQDLQRGLKFHQLLGKDIEKDPELKAIAEQQKKYYNQKYNINKFVNELQICLLITSYNNQGSKRYIANLDSVYSQEYENYFVIYINDASRDATGYLVESYINQHPRAKQRTLLVNNTVQKKKSRNQYEAGHAYCKPGSIMYVLDGDDTIIGRQFFKLLNAIYQQRKTMFVYLNYLQIKWQFNPPQLHYGYNGYLQEEVIKTRTYRQSKNYPINPRTWMTDIFLNISFADYTHHYKFVPAGEDLMLMPSLLQLAGDRIVHLPDVTYYYNTATGMNDNGSRNTIKYRFSLLQDVIKGKHQPQYKQQIKYRLRNPEQLKKQAIKITKNRWINNEYNKNSKQLSNQRLT